MWQGIISIAASLWMDSQFRVILIAISAMIIIAIAKAISSKYQESASAKRFSVVILSFIAATYEQSIISPNLDVETIIRHAVVLMFCSFGAYESVGKAAKAILSVFTTVKDS